MKDKEMDRTEGYRPYDIEDPEVRKSLRGRWFRDVREDDTPEMMVSSFGCNEDGYEWCVNEIYTARTFLRDCVWMDDGSPCGVKEEKKVETHVPCLYDVYRSCDDGQSWGLAYTTGDLWKAYRFAKKDSAPGHYHKIVQYGQRIADHNTSLVSAVGNALRLGNLVNLHGCTIESVWLVDSDFDYPFDTLGDAVSYATGIADPYEETLK